MKKRIIAILLVSIPGVIAFFYYIKNFLTKFADSDIFDISLNEDNEEDF